MDIKRAPKKRVLWQDIKPAVAPLKPIDIKPIKKQRIIPSIKSFFKFPVFKKVKIKLPKITRKMAIIGSVAFIIIAIPVGYYLVNSNIFKSISTLDTDNQSTDNSTPILSHGTPGYTTISPSDKKVDDLGGWTRINPPDTDPVFAYTDKIGEISINVSEQQLPESFRTDTDRQIELLSQGYKASEKITINGTIVHIGTSAKGPQSVIFTKNGLLILIKSNAPISSDQWVKYISSLQ